MNTSTYPHSLHCMVNKKDLTSDDVRSQHGGGLGIRTLATVTRPNDLANRPLQPLE